MQTKTFYFCFVYKILLSSISLSISKSLDIREKKILEIKIINVYYLQELTNALIMFYVVLFFFYFVYSWNKMGKYCIQQSNITFDFTFQKKLKSFSVVTIQLISNWQLCLNIQNWQQCVYVRSYAHKLICDQEIKLARFQSIGFGLFHRQAFVSNIASTHLEKN